MNVLYVEQEDAFLNAYFWFSQNSLRKVRRKKTPKTAEKIAKKKRFSRTYAKPFRAPYKTRFSVGGCRTSHLCLQAVGKVDTVHLVINPGLRQVTTYVHVSRRKLSSLQKESVEHYRLLKYFGVTLVYYFPVFSRMRTHCAKARTCNELNFPISQADIGRLTPSWLTLQIDRSMLISSMDRVLYWHTIEVRFVPSILSAHYGSLCKRYRWVLVNFRCTCPCILNSMHL